MTILSRTPAAARVLCALLAALGLAPGKAMAQKAVQIPPLSPRYVPEPRKEPEDTTGLRFRLHEADPRAAPAPAGPTSVRGAPLTPAETERLLRRLSPLRADAAPADSFVFPAHSPPPPRTGVTIHAPFPPPDITAHPDVPAAGALRVVRRAPEGAVDVEAGIGVTVVFSQPMVPLGAVSETAAREAPATLSPRAPGRWRWVDVSTLRFEPEGRLPMATRYTVTVPAGTRSATGGALPRAERWSFSTPAPRALGAYPHGSAVSRDPVLLVEWSQRVDPAAVLATTRLLAGKQSVRVRLATPEEVAADSQVARLVKGLEPGRWTAFRALGTLPGDAAVRVVVGPGTPSAEGPLRTGAAQEWSFRTYGPLRVVEHECGWGGRCPPGQGWSVHFSNPLDAAAWSDSLLRVEPELPDLAVVLWEDRLIVRGSSRPLTTYRVHLSPAIRDRFGQTLGQVEPLVFRVGAPVPQVWGAPEGMVVLDPAGPPRIPVFSQGVARLRVRVHRVRPEDWHRFQPYYRPDTDTLPGTPVLSRVLELDASRTEVVQTVIDLTPALEGGLGHAVVAVEPVGEEEDEVRRQSIRFWVQSTRIGLAALADDEELVGWATSLVDGRPLSGVRLSLAGAAASTGEEGLATLPLPPEAERERERLLVARLGSDVAVLPERSGRGGWARWSRRERADALAWYTFTDRNLYRPGEEVRFKGWIRRLAAGEDSAPALPGAALDSVRFTAVDAQGNELHRGAAALTAFGGFDAAFTVPPGTNLGSAHLRLEAVGAPEGVRMRQSSLAFQVQEFRRPEYEVSVEAAEPGPHRVGGSAVVAARASYYAGGGLPGAEVRWSVRATPGSFTPPGWSGWTFGGGGGFGWHPRPYARPVVKQLEGRTDGEGAHAVRLEFEEAVPPYPSSVEAQATVMDVNRQPWTAKTRLLVHPAALYAGLRTGRAWLPRGEPLEVEVVAVELDGKPAAGRPVEVRAWRTEWRQVEGEWTAVEADEQHCAVVSEAEPVRCAFRTEKGGRYRVAATLRDDAGRPTRTELAAWVSGAEPDPRPDQAEELEVELVADREEYRPGDTAEILVQAPFHPARGVVTVLRGGIARTEAITVEGPTKVVRVPIGERDVPNLQVRVDLVGAGTDSVRGTDFAGGTVEISVPPRHHTLRVTAAPRDSVLEPEGETTVEVEVRDASGKPVRDAEVALVVVDEAVLALTGHELRDPLSVFFPRRYPAVSQVGLRPSVLLWTPEMARLDSLALAEEEFSGVGRTGLSELVPPGAPPPPPPPPAPAAVMRRARDAGDEPSPIAVRANFDPLAAFVAAARTDARGRVAVPVTLPSSLTRYRVMAAVVAGETDAGLGESGITARKGLMVRPSPPRFLNFGDRFDLPVVLQNQTGAPLTVEVAVRAAGVEVADAGRRVTVPAHDRVEVRFPAATTRPGMARFQVAAAAAGHADAAELSLPVWTPATAEAFATYGVVDSGAVVLPVRVPGAALPGFGGLEVTTSSTAVQELTDALIYLVRYPFECAEQISSRVLAVAALRDVLAAFEAEQLPPPEELKESVERDVAALARLQNADGGWGFWRRGDESWPFVTVHVAHALQRAREKGFTVPEATLERARRYLEQVEGHLPAEYPQEVKGALAAYAVYVRGRMDDPRAAPDAAALLAQTAPGALTLEAEGWILSTLAGEERFAGTADSLRARLAGRAVETAATATFATSYGEGDWLILHSDRRTDAVVLEALIAADPESDLIPKVVRGLLAHRRKGRWQSTQENAWVLLALDRYFGTYEKETPEFVARAWLGERYAGGHRFEGRTTERHHLELPMRVLEPGDTTALTLGKEGAGRMYYRAGLRYAPADLELAPAQHGFAVERAYEGVDDPSDVRRGADGVWRVRPGARVRVTVTMTAPARRHHVALVDPLPAGFEPVNPELLGTERDSGEAGPRPGPYGGWWRWTWWEHQNLRDSRAEAFTSLLPAGTYTYSYVARATTPGSYVVPPPRAEEMYHPETFGRGATARVRVEEP